MFGIQKVVGTWGELALGPLLLVIGLFMLVGDRLNLPQFGFSGNAEGLASLADRGSVCPGFLSHKRCVLFRYADPSVGFRDSRLSVAGRICRSHGDTGACRCLDTGFQCAADGQFLRQDAEGAEVDESPCGSRIYSHRHLLLLDNVCINKINN